MNTKNEKDKIGNDTPKETFPQGRDQQYQQKDASLQSGFSDAEDSSFADEDEDLEEADGGTQAYNGPVKAAVADNKISKGTDKNLGAAKVPQKGQLDSSKTAKQDVWNKDTTKINK